MESLELFARRYNQPSFALVSPTRTPGQVFGTIVDLIWSHQDEKVSFWWGLFGAEDGRLAVELHQHGSGCRGVPHAVMRRPGRHGQKCLSLGHEAYGGR